MLFFSHRKQRIRAQSDELSEVRSSRSTAAILSPCNAGRRGDPAAARPEVKGQSESLDSELLPVTTVSFISDVAKTKQRNRLKLFRLVKNR